MALPTDPTESRRRIKAFEKTKRSGQKHGSVTEAAMNLGNITPSALSRWLLQRNIKTFHEAEYSKDDCILELKRLTKQLGRIPARDDWKTISQQRMSWRSHWARYEDFVASADLKDGDARILLLDIETAPNRAFVWGTWKQNINPDWIDANGYVLCWTAKWLGEDESQFLRLKNKNHKALLYPIHKMLHEASAVIHYNGTDFDIPTLNKEFLTHGLTPPSPYKQIDLLRTMREKFRFPNNKLDYICKTLSIGEKLRHEGPQLWLDCMKDEPKAWEKMESYNRRDVDILERLYRRLLPWIKNHPNRAAMSGFEACPSCESTNFKRDGTYLANQLKYERYRCSECGTWFRGTKTVNHGKEKRFALAA